VKKRAKNVASPWFRGAPAGSTVDYRRKVTVPIRRQDGSVYCLVDVYGVEPKDLMTVGGGIGSQPLVKAVERLGLNPNKYTATIWDIPS
jgi:hypothetical protein